MSYFKLSWFLLSLLNYHKNSWLLVRKIFLRLRCTFVYASLRRNRLREQMRWRWHKNRLTMYCYKSRFHWIFIGIFGIKNDFSFLISTSSKKMVGQEELESSTFAVSERHSNQLNYWPINIFWFQAISSADTRIHQKEIFRQSHLGWPFSWKRFSL